MIGLLLLDFQEVQELVLMIKILDLNPLEIGKGRIIELKVISDSNY